jgi:6-phosphogluconolactonase (cycloisomerase 2 family)
MRRSIRLAVGLGALGVLLGAFAFVAPAIAAAQPTQTGPWYGGGPDHNGHVVFVQNDNPSGNAVFTYDRSADGTLTLANSYQTGGLGGVLNGSVVDHLASQGSLTYDQADSVLYAVNAGSNTVSVFSVRGDQLFLRQVIGSGGVFPVSVAVHGNLVYVLNAESASIQGYVSSLGYLFPLYRSNRSLGITVPSDKTQYVETPGQVAFSPDGSQLVVTTKANGDDIDVFQVGAFGLPSAAPVVNPEPGTVPFAVTFDPAGHLVVSDAGTNALSTFDLYPSGTVSLVDTLGNGQSATCWVASAQGFFYTSNAGSADLSGYGESFAGELSLIGNTTTDAGTVDASATPDGQFLYVQTGGSGIVDEFHVQPDGSLSEIATVTVPGAVGGEGIFAS